MRQDQFEKLQALSEKLTEVFIGEADPDKWPGVGIEPGVMDQQTRGDRYWCKKNAVATLSLVGRIQSVSGMIRGQAASGMPPPDEPEQTSELDKEIAAAEKEAAQLLDKVQKQSQKRRFDEKVHGKQKG